MFCFHKFGEVKDGYQYCEKCGIVNMVPCSHKWETIQVCTKFRKHEITGREMEIGKIYHQKCKLCGEIQQTQLDVN